MRIRHALLAAALLALAPAPAPARAAQPQAGLHFIFADLTGDFGRQVGREGYGLSLEGLLPVGRQGPLALGLRAGFVSYGHESEQLPFSPTLPGLWVDVDRDNNLALGQLLLRLQPRRGALRPYGEAFVGLNYLFTRTTARSEGDGEEIASSQNWDDTAFAWGFGGGLLARLGHTRHGPICLDLGATVVRGGRARYLAEGDIEVIDGRLTYFVHDSYTDFVQWRLGVMFAFD